MSDVGFECGLAPVRRRHAGGGRRSWRPASLDPPQAALEPAATCAWSPEEAGARPLLFGEAELACAVAGACAKLRQELATAFAADERRRLAQGVEAVLTRLDAALAALAAALDESRGAIVGLLQLALRRAVPVLFEQVEEEAVRRVLEGWSRRVLPEDVLVVRVRPEVREALAAASTAHASGPRFEFVADPALPPGGVVLELSRGCARHDPAGFVEELVDALAGLLDAGRDDRRHSMTTDGEEEREP